MDEQVCFAIPISFKIVFDRIESLEAWGYLMETICPKFSIKKGTGVRKILKLIKYKLQLQMTTLQNL
jgi:hypothetical protein